MLKNTLPFSIGHPLRKWTKSSTRRSVSTTLVSGIFAGIGLKLVDFKVEYGRHYQGEEVQLMLADEISPDSCRLWEFGTNRKLDKDRFRQDMGDVEEAYQEVANRLGLTPKSGTGEVTKLEIIKS